MGTGHILVLSSDGGLLSEFGRARTNDGDFRFPEQLASGPNGLWAIADRENNRVVLFTLSKLYPKVDDILSGKYGPGLSTGKQRARIGRARRVNVRPGRRRRTHLCRPACSRRATASGTGHDVPVSAGAGTRERRSGRARGISPFPAFTPARGRLTNASR